MAHFDTEEVPASRQGEKCVNCQFTSSAHYGWRCPDVEIEFDKYSDLTEVQRYCTQSMLDSVKAERLPNKYLSGNSSVVMQKDMSDWRSWRHDRKGDCCCGIPRERCDYHR